jgi:hypothetical protein
MQMQPPKAGLYEYTYIEQVVKEINEHAKKQAYSVTRKRSKRSKKGVLMKTWIQCDRGGDEDPKGYGHRITSSKRVACPFECIAKLQFNIQDENGLGDWILTVEDGSHNHPSTKPAASIVQRNIAIRNPTVLHEIKKEFRKGSKASSVLKGLRMDEDGGVLKLTDLHRHWLYAKPPRVAARRAEEQEDHTMNGDEDDADADIEVRGTPPADMPPPPRRQILQIQEPAIVKAKGRPRGAPNRLWAGAAPPRPTASQRRRQQAFEASTQREPSGFELTPELPSSQVPDSQPQSQRGGLQPGGRGGRQRGGRGGGRGGVAEGRNAGVPAFYMGSFRM